MADPTLTFLKLVPRNALSRAVGAALRSPLPRPVHHAAIRWFVRRYGVDLSDATRPVEGYPSFNAFFTRELRPGARPVAEGADVLVSPCDGALGVCGTVESGAVLQAKGRPYDLDAFLGGAGWAERFEGGTFLTVYLAPFDYHRVHHPIAGEVVEALHVPGTLWPVNAAAVDRIEDLFVVNERVTTFVASAFGPVAVVMVGATNVGRIRMRYDDVVSNAGRRHGRRRYDPALPVEKGDELGVFEMGSTVVLVLPPGAFEATADLTPGRKVRMGEALGRLREPA